MVARAHGAAQTCFVLGVGLILSVLNVYFRDVKHFVDIALQALFYSAPIVYPVTLVPSTPRSLGVSVPVRLPVQPEPDGPLRRGVPRRALQPALPDAWRRRSTSSCWAAGAARVRAVGLQQARAAVWRRSCDDATPVDHRRPRLEALPAVPRAQPVAEGRVHAGGRARYEEFWALDDVSLEVPEGTTFGLIGENGSGKSTLLKCIARILRPDQGIDLGARQGLGAARAGRRLPPRAVRPRERLPQRLDPRPEQASSSTPVRRDRRLRRPRAVHRHAGEELLVGHVRAARVLGRHQRRPRHPPRRRGPRRRRRSSSSASASRSSPSSAARARRS